MTIERRVIGDVHVLALEKDLVEKDDVQSLMAIINEVAAAGPAKVVVDLGSISWANSIGFGGLWTAKRTCDNTHGWLRLARPGKNIKHVLPLLSIRFDTFETVEEAVAAEEKRSRDR